MDKNFTWNQENLVNLLARKPRFEALGTSPGTHTTETAKVSVTLQQLTVTTSVINLTCANYSDLK